MAAERSAAGSVNHLLTSDRYGAKAFVATRLAVLRALTLTFLDCTSCLVNPLDRKHARKLTVFAERLELHPVSRSKNSDQLVIDRHGKAEVIRTNFVTHNGRKTRDRRTVRERINFHSLRLTIAPNF